MSGPGPKPPWWGGDGPAPEPRSISFPSVDSVAPGPWGFWATMIWLVAILVSVFAVSLLIMIPYLILFHPGFFRQAGQEAGDFISGDINWIVILVQYVAAGYLLLLALYFRRDYGYRKYLALHRVGWRYYVLGLVALLVYNFGCGAIIHLLKVETPEWMEAVYSNIRFWPGLLFALLVWAPVWEELIFRGFVYAGIQARLGAAPAIVIPALIWSLIHATQYQWSFMLVIFGLGLIFGIARWKSGSIFVPIALHVLNNLLASIPLLMPE